MKKFVAILTVLAMLLGTVALGESIQEKYELLRVGTTTEFNGNFFSDTLGNNVSDQDVRKLIHSYSLVSWANEDGVFRPNQQVVTAFSISGDGRTFTFVISRDLKYSDGTPISAKDYAFSFLLQTSRALEEAAGRRQDGSRLMGWKDYDEGRKAEVSGLRVIGENQLSFTMGPDYDPYFYELQFLDITPFPIDILAPGCTVVDDGQGARIQGTLTGDILRKTLTDPENGYMSHPTVTSGPYRLTDYDGTKAELELNPEYLGDANFVLPTIPKIEFRFIAADQLIGQLAAGTIDLAVRCARNDQIMTGMQLAQNPDFMMYAYSRNGLAFISFCAEKGPTADVRVRRALSMCIDRDALIRQYLGNFGVAVNGYYGIGQWMYLVSNGTIRPETEDDWDAVNLDGLTVYGLDPEGAAALLDEAGWNLNAEGQPYTEGLRYKEENGQLVPLKLKLIYADENAAGPMLKEAFGTCLAEAGAELQLETVSMPEMLQKYYGTAERDCDMIMLGTNFTDVFEPSADFDEGTDTNRLNGITDAKFAALARDLRKTEPGDIYGYSRKWVDFMNYRTEIASEIPLYSNAYMDFAITELQDYHPGDYSSWAEAVQYSVLSDYAEPEEEAMEDGEDDGEFFE